MIFDPGVYIYVRDFYTDIKKLYERILTSNQNYPLF